MSKVYMTYWTYVNHYAGSWGHFKLFRIQRGSVESDSNGAPGFVVSEYGGFHNFPTSTLNDWWCSPYPCIDDGYGPKTGPCGTQRVGAGYDHIIGASGIVPGNSGNRDQWLRVEVYVEQGSENTCNGTFQYWMHKPGASISKATQADYDGNLLVRTSSQDLHYVFIGHYAGDDSTFHLKQWIDDVFIQVGGRQRVEIGDNSFWSSCTYRDIQIPTYWSDNGITIKFNKGSFNQGQTAYLFVVDENGNVNSQGHPIVIGGGGGGDDTAPTTSGHAPSKDATSVAVDSNVLVHVLDSGDGVDQSSIVMVVDGQTVSPTIAGNSDNYTVTYDPPDDFFSGQDVTVTIDAQDLHDPPNVMPQDSYSFTVALAPDTTDPTVNITQPTSGDAYSTDQDHLTLGGGASDNTGVTSVTWASNRGGSGTASGTTSWTISNITLQDGENVITVTAHDAAGNAGPDTLTITYTPPAGTYTEEFGSATGTDHPGTLKDTYIRLNTANYSSEDLLNTYTWPQDQVANAIVMKWDLSAIPSSASVQDATLYLYLNSMTDGGGDNTYDLTVHKVVNYNPVVSACTGYTYDGTNSWTANSQCYNNVPMAQADIEPPEDTQSIDKIYDYKSWSVTNMVRGWVSNPASNYGMLVNSDPIATSSSNRYFNSTESSNPDQRPKLVVTYTVDEQVDTTDPTVAITSPVSQDTYSTEEDTVDLGGSAWDDVSVTSVTWTNSRGGSGTASGTDNWTISGITVQCGDDNVLTVSAQDAAGNSGTDTLTVDVKPCTPSGFDTQ
ncbi:MAG: DNRLRE domain-containing protein [Thermodesulfobacteriota bacterium]|nr:DNRLRE domain-containing protein [Thermodesulfobacteriota bacterium]